MASNSSTTIATGSDISEAENLLPDDVVQSSVDFKGLIPTVRSKSGGWEAASFIIGVEMAVMFAHYGIRANLISYLTGPLGQSTAKAAANVNAWSGVSYLSPVLGAFVADSYLGKYRAIIISSLLYILGLGFLSLSAALYSSNSSDCQNASNNKACSPPQLQITLFYFSLYLIALAHGGSTPCLQAFGADQFDEKHEKERISKGSFFNWWNFCNCISVLVALLVLSYVQENISWELGFGIPCILMCFTLIPFFMWSTRYRFRVNTDTRNPFVRISRVFVKAVKDLKATRNVICNIEEEAQHEGFSNKSLNEPRIDSVDDIEDAKAIIRLLPICFTCLPYAITISQSPTLFTKQGATMDRYVTANFQIPSAALQSLTSISMVIFIPFYDRVLIPIARAITRKPSSVSMLQRIGIGIFLSVVSMVMAGFIERKRLETAAEYKLVDFPEATIPMSVWWLAPQYLFHGISDVFAMISLQEFVYDNVPNDLKSMGVALFLGIIGSGSFLSGLLISVIEKVTSGHGHESWFANNLNRAHLDYFYWLLAGLNSFSFILFIHLARCYVCNEMEKRPSEIALDHLS